MPKTKAYATAQLNALPSMTFGLIETGTDDQCENGTQTNASYSNYAPVAVTFGSVEADGITRKNSAQIVLASYSGSTKTFARFGLWRAAAPYDLLYYTDPVNIQLASGDVPTFAAGSISIVEN